MRYENASRGHGSKARYLNDLVEVEKKMAVKPVEFREGSPHEQRSAERQRRRTVAGQLGYQGAAAGFGAAATTAAAGKLAGTHVGQAHLKGSAKGYEVAGNKEAAKTVEDIARFGRWSKKHGKKAGAIVTGGTALATGAATMARVRGNEEQGMSQEIGQFKGGRKYKKDVTTLSKNFRLFSTLAAELDRGAPNINRARKIIDEHGKKIAIGAGGTAAGGGLIATGVSRKRRKKDESALRALSKRDFNSDEKKGHRRNLTGLGLQTAGWTGLVGSGFAPNLKTGLAVGVPGAMAIGVGDRLSAKGRAQARRGAAARHAEEKGVAKAWDGGERLRRASEDMQRVLNDPEDQKRMAAIRAKHEADTAAHAERRAAREAAYEASQKSDSAPRRVGRGKLLGAAAVAGASAPLLAYAAMRHGQNKIDTKRKLSKREAHKEREYRELLRNDKIMMGTGLTAAGLTNYAMRKRPKIDRAIGTSLGLAWATDAALSHRRTKKKGIQKSDKPPLKTSVSEDDARKLVDRHGLKGPLPKGLTREQKMAAYEARYVSAGGRKSEKWDRKARGADKVKNVGLGVATAGGATWLATRGRSYRSLSAIKETPRREHAENLAAAGAVVGGGAELYAGHARRKRSSYASAPGGVAASALRRMQDNTP